jgi:hypothetical protein
MKGVIVSIAVGLLVSLLFIAAAIFPPTPEPAGVVTKDSQVEYVVGEKVMANPYRDDEWYQGRIVGVTTEDEYLVEWCGNVGWFDKYECSTKTLRRTQLAKTEGGK